MYGGRLLSVAFFRAPGYRESNGKCEADDNARKYVFQQNNPLWRSHLNDIDVLSCQMLHVARHELDIATRRLHGIRLAQGAALAPIPNAFFFELQALPIEFDPEHKLQKNYKEKFRKKMNSFLPFIRL
ncbi:hypothetical protein [Paenibacillus elgii]|uniref:hypothetical protein n=1 Tax=Paenibacillus elgii TaxID=189691 RepID=UPI000248DDBF|nr:hypothetical protein [Paenibacillus elgii]